MSTQKKRKSKATHRINVYLTESQYQRLNDYADDREITMSEAIRELIKDIPMKKPSTIEKTPLQT
jgi:hypothetical protein